VVTYAYLLRVPLLVALLVAFVAWQARRPNAAGYALLHGLFDTPPRGLFFTTVQATLLVVTQLACTDVVLLQGGARFGVRLPEIVLSQIDLLVVKVSVGTVALGVLYLGAGALFVFTAAKLSHGSKGKEGLALACGATTAGMLLLGLSLTSAVIRHWMTQGARVLSPWLGPGFLDPVTRELLPGHDFMIVCLAAALVLFVLFGLRIFRPPTLTSFLNLVLLITLQFAGMAFLFDHFRVPFLLTLAAVLAVAGLFTKSDQYFGAYYNKQPRAMLTPKQALTGGAHQDCAIIICASGGGIQAAAWAARVLVGLDEFTRGRFATRVRLISSVSGGSVGSMYFTASYQGGHLYGHRDIIDAARASSLDAIAFGLVYRDFVRALLPMLFWETSGRGSAAEDAWMAHRAAPKRPGEQDTANWRTTPVLLAEWRESVRRGERPAHIFNTMIAETGERCLASTVDLEEGPGRREMNDLYPTFDIAPVTAARLSAAFPFVGPAARIFAKVSPERAFHFVDGGYYDNFGVVSAVDFLRSATKGGSPVPRFLMVHITGHGVDYESKNPNGHEPARPRGWFYQVIAPMTALLQMRTTAQVSRNITELKMLEDLMEKRGVEFAQVNFSFPRGGEPLSWHLTSAEQGEIEEVWQKDPVIQQGKEAVAAFLGQEPGGDLQKAESGSDFGHSTV
jgi:hypothetical protein